MKIRDILHDLHFLPLDDFVKKYGKIDDDLVRMISLMFELHSFEVCDDCLAKWTRYVFEHVLDDEQRADLRRFMNIFYTMFKNNSNIIDIANLFPLNSLIGLFLFNQGMLESLDDVNRENLMNALEKEFSAGIRNVFAAVFLMIITALTSVKRVLHIDELQNEISVATGVDVELSSTKTLSLLLVLRTIRRFAEALIVRSLPDLFEEMDIHPRSSQARALQAFFTDYMMLQQNGEESRELH